MSILFLPIIGVAGSLIILYWLIELCIFIFFFFLHLYSLQDIVEVTPCEMEAMFSPICLCFMVFNMLRNN